MYMIAYSVAGCPMEDATFDEILERLVLASGAQNEIGLATFLGISAQSIYNAKKKNGIPPAWGIEVAKTFTVSWDWIFFGTGCMYTEEDKQIVLDELCKKNREQGRKI